MKHQRLILGFFTFFLQTSVYSANEIRVVYKQPHPIEEAKAHAFIVENKTTDSIVKLLNTAIRLNKPVTIEFASGRLAFADLEESKLLIPYSYILEVQTQYSQHGLTINAINDTIAHLVLHEFAHLIIAMYDIPILGREEDAADSFASYLLMLFYGNGAEKVLNASEIYRIEQENPKTLKKWDFMSEHSLSVQRYYQFICYVYGSNPEKYQKLRRKTGLTKRRASLCIDEFKQISNSWRSLLKPYLQRSKSSNLINAQ